MVKTASKSMHKWRRYPFSTGKKLTKNAVRNLSVCCGAIWRHRAKPQYRCTTTIHPVHNSPKDVLENLPPLWRLVHAHNLVHSEPFLDYRYEVWHLVSALCSDVWKKTLYRCTSTYILGPKLLQWNFLQISQLSIRSRAHKLFRRFWDFSKLLTAISRTLWRQLATKMRTM